MVNHLLTHRGANAVNTLKMVYTRVYQHFLYSFGKNNVFIFKIIDIELTKKDAISSWIDFFVELVELFPVIFLVVSIIIIRNSSFFIEISRLARRNAFLALNT